jgi:ubiquinone/menaquinone biosynthesis C-methylase UbiE
MTDEMLALARENQRKAGITNAEFLKGQIEAVPLSDASVDVVISNCVLNLSVNKPKAFAEAFRVLRPGGLFAVSDIVVRGEMPAEVRRSLELYLGCFAGALDERKFEELLSLAGFTDVSIVPTRVYSADVARPLLANAGLDPMLAEMLDGRFASAFVRARKPK